MVIGTNLAVTDCQMLYTKFQQHLFIGYKEEVFKGLYLIWTWQPSWSCDQDHLNKSLFIHPKVDLHEFDFD